MLTLFAIIRNKKKYRDKEERCKYIHVHMARNLKKKIDELKAEKETEILVNCLHHSKFLRYYRLPDCFHSLSDLMQRYTCSTFG